jgi:hypothetical protein
MASDNKEKTNMQPSRRSFLKMIWAVFGILAALEFLFMIFTFLGRRKRGEEKGETENLIDAGNVDKYHVNSSLQTSEGIFYLRGWRRRFYCPFKPNEPYGLHQYPGMI